MTVDRISSLYPTLHREIKRPIYQPKHEHTLAIFSPAKALLREPPNDSFDIDLIRTPHYLFRVQTLEQRNDVMLYAWVWEHGFWSTGQVPDTNRCR